MKNEHRGPLVKNAANPKEVKGAKKREDLKRINELSDMKKIMSLPEGRRFLHKILAECRVHQTVWQANAAIHRDAGKQELGHFIMGEMVRADRDLAARMVAEAYEREIEGEDNV